MDGNDIVPDENEDDAIIARMTSALRVLREQDYGSEERARAEAEGFAAALALKMGATLAGELLELGRNRERITKAGRLNPNDRALIQTWVNTGEAQDFTTALVRVLREGLTESILRARARMEKGATPDEPA